MNQRGGGGVSMPCISHEALCCLVFFLTIGFIKHQNPVMSSSTFELACMGPTSCPSGYVRE